MNWMEARRHVELALLDVVPDADVDRLPPDEALQHALDLDSVEFLAFVERLSVRAQVPIDLADYRKLTTYHSCILFLGSAPDGTVPVRIRRNVPAAVVSNAATRPARAPSLVVAVQM